MEKSTQIFGLRAIIEAINAGDTIEKVFLQKGLRGDLYKQLEQTARKNRISVSYVPVEKLNRLSDKNHQGAIANLSPIAYQDLETIALQVVEAGKNPLFLLLDEITDVRNFGAIIRTAECAGVNAIVVGKQGAAPINADTVKTSAGAVFKIPICKVDHIKDAVFMLQSMDITVVAATEKTDNSIYDIDLKAPAAIIMGSEGRGINPSILKLVNHKAKLPLQGAIESLNVSVACGAFLYEVVRQRM